MALELESLDQLEARHAIEEARRTRLDALSGRLIRRRATRSRIVLGGAILAELRDNPEDAAFLNRIVKILDERVLRDRDRNDLRDLLSVPIPVMTAEPLDDSDVETQPDFEQIIEAVHRPPRPASDTYAGYSDVKGLPGKET